LRSQVVESVVRVVLAAVPEKRQRRAVHSFGATEQPTAVVARLPESGTLIFDAMTVEASSIVVVTIAKKAPTATHSRAEGASVAIVGAGEKTSAITIARIGIAKKTPANGSPAKVGITEKTPTVVPITKKSLTGTGNTTKATRVPKAASIVAKPRSLQMRRAEVIQRHENKYDRSSLKCAHGGDQISSLAILDGLEMALSEFGMFLDNTGLQW